MVLLLATSLDVPLRERNRWLPAAGYAPMYRETALTAPEMRPAQQAREFVLQWQETQALCQPLRDQLMCRNLVIYSRIEEAGHGDAPRGAKATAPADWRRAHMLALPETRRRGRRAFTCRDG